MRDDEVDEDVTVIKEQVTKVFGAHVVKKKESRVELPRESSSTSRSGGATANSSSKRIRNCFLVHTREKGMRRLKSDETIIEASKKYDSQKNSIAERAVQTVEGQRRAILFALERRLDANVPVLHKVTMCRWTRH